MHQLTTTQLEKVCNIDYIEKTTALNDRVFFDKIYLQTKIKALQNIANFRSQIGIILTKIATMTGIKNPIDDFTKQDLIKLILRRYSNLCPSEIYKAFENERYGVNGQKTEHYQLFDANYVSTIIDKYLHWKQTQKVALNWGVPQKQTTLALPDISDTEKHERMTKEINRLFTTYLLQGHLDNEIIVHVYKELCDRSIIFQKSDKPEEQAKLDRFFANQYRKAKEQTLQEYSQKARQINYYKQTLHEIQNNQNNGAVITKMQRNILCDVFEKHRNDQDFVKRINSLQNPSQAGDL